MNADFSEKFEGSKMMAERAVRECFSGIETELRRSVTTLRKAGQRSSLEIDPIVQALKDAKKEWVEYMSTVFDGAIMSLKQKLGELNAEN
jgi:hypothetical protein